MTLPSPFVSQYGPPVPKNAKPLLAPIVITVASPLSGSMPSSGSSSWSVTRTGSSDFWNAKSAVMKTNSEMISVIVPLARISAVSKSIATLGAGSPPTPSGSGPVWTLSEPPSSLEKSTAGLALTSVACLPPLNSTLSLPLSVTEGMPSSCAVPEAFSAVKLSGPGWPPAVAGSWRISASARLTSWSATPIESNASGSSGSSSVPSPLTSAVAPVGL